MDQKPFVRLAAPRSVNRPELPPDLTEFYTWHEGIGLESSPDYCVRLCKLEEVEQVGWMDMSLEDVEGWERFAAFRIGMGTCGETILRVLDAPSCPPGSILAIGSILSGGGSGGEGPYALEPSLVLARSFPDWLAHLERWGWLEPIIAGMGDLPKREWQEAYRYYLGLNPAFGPC
jgi:hypothetical protein